MTLNNYKHIAKETEVKRIERVIPYLSEIQFLKYSNHFKNNKSVSADVLNTSQVYFSFFNKDSWKSEFSLTNLFLGNTSQMIEELAIRKNDLVICFFPTETKATEMNRFYRFIKLQLLKKGMIAELNHNLEQNTEQFNTANKITEPIITIRKMTAKDLQFLNTEKYDIFRRIFFLRHYLKKMDLFTETGTYKYLYIASTQLSQLYIKISCFLLGLIFLILTLMTINYTR